MDAIKVLPTDSAIPWVELKGAELTSGDIFTAVAIWTGCLILVGVGLHLWLVTFAASDEDKDNHLDQLRLWLGDSGFLGIAFSGAVVILLGFLVILSIRYGQNIAQNLKLTAATLINQGGKVAATAEGLGLSPG